MLFLDKQITMQKIALQLMLNRIKKNRMRKLSTGIMSLSILFVLMILSNISYAQDKNGLAQVNKYAGLYVFFDCKPANDYEIIAIYKKAVVCENFKDCAERYADKIRVEFPEAEGFLISNLNSLSKDRFEIIKFKTKDKE